MNYMTEQQKKLIEIATKCVSAPYKYGATKQDIPNAFDCSLFIQYIYASVGIELPRSTIEQAEIGIVISDISQLEIGDLIFLHGTRGHYNAKFPQGIGHVVMFIGDGKVIHAGSRRTQEKPIIEEGGVEIRDLNDVIQKTKPVVLITRPLTNA
jgi:peptidoglycan endopeptidase LytE